MAFSFSITDVADRQFQALSAREQRILEASIRTRLTHQPTSTTRAIRRLRPNPFAEFELRAGDLRVLYNVQQDQVIIQLIGRKVGNQLIVEGEVFHGHQDHPAESPGDSAGADAE